MKGYIYALCDGDIIMYVGATVNPIGAYMRHRTEAASGSKTPKARWVRAYVNAGKTPRMKILAYGDMDHDCLAALELETIGKLNPPLNQSRMRKARNGNMAACDIDLVALMRNLLSDIDGL